MNKNIKFIGLGIIILAVIAGAFYFINNNSSKKTIAAQNTCTSKEFAPASSGNCVSDIQTMVNFMQTNQLNQCPFSGGASLSINGNYDDSTTAQVKVVQSWLNCYNKQEGAPVINTVNGTVDAATWTGLCTYAYQYPSHNNQSPSPYLKQTLIAGKDAGC